MFRNLSGIPRVLAFLVTAWIFYYVFTQPADAGNTVQAGLGYLKEASNQIATFVKSIAK